MLAQQGIAVHAGNLADAIPRDGLNWNGLTVAAFLSATPGPRPVPVYGLRERHMPPLPVPNTSRSCLLFDNRVESWRWLKIST